MGIGTTLSLNGAEFRYPASDRSTLRGADLEIRAGECIAILGPNGSGKSTLLKLFNALLTPTQGICFVDGLDTRDEANVEKIRARAAMVFQNPEDQIVAAVVEEDTAFGPENLGLSSEEIRARVKEALTATGLWERRKHQVSSLSGGQKQRLALAGALAVQPGCLLLDEAMSMLDPQARSEFMRLIENERARGLTIVQVTHRLDEIIGADRVVILEDGRVTWSGGSDEFLSQSAEKLRAMNLRKPKISVLRDELAARGLIPPATRAEVSCIKDALCR
jgi:energy-coupling factor transport system ATP-binding protein